VKQLSQRMEKQLGVISISSLIFLKQGGGLIRKQHPMPCPALGIDLLKKSIGGLGMRCRWVHQQSKKGTAGPWRNFGWKCVWAPL
jgi:hypothetical protein